MLFSTKVMTATILMELWIYAWNDGYVISHEVPTNLSELNDSRNDLTANFSLQEGMSELDRVLRGLLSSLINIATSIGSATKGKPQKKISNSLAYCETEDLKGNENRTYLFGVTTWSKEKNYESAIPANTIKEAVTHVIENSTDFGIILFCTNVNNGDTWSANVRVCLCEYANFCRTSIWHIYYVDF